MSRAASRPSGCFDRIPTEVCLMVLEQLEIKRQRPNRDTSVLAATNREWLSIMNELYPNRNKQLDLSEASRKNLHSLIQAVVNRSSTAYAVAASSSSVYVEESVGAKTLRGPFCEQIQEIVIKGSGFRNDEQPFFLRHKLDGAIAELLPLPLDKNDTAASTMVDNVKALFERGVRDPDSPNGLLALLVLVTVNLEELVAISPSFSDPIFLKLIVEKQNTDRVTGAKTFPALRILELLLPFDDVELMTLPKLEVVTLRQGSITRSGLLQLLRLSENEDALAQSPLQSLTLLGVQGGHEATTELLKVGKCQLGALKRVYIQDTTASDGAVAKFLETLATLAPQISALTIDQAYREADYDASAEPVYYGYGPLSAETLDLFGAFTSLETLMICRDFLFRWEVATNDHLHVLKQFVTKGPRVSHLAVTGLFLEDIERMAACTFPSSWPESFHELSLYLDFGWVQDTDLSIYVEEFNDDMAKLTDAGAKIRPTGINIKFFLRDVSGLEAQTIHHDI